MYRKAECMTSLNRVRISTAAALLVSYFWSNTGCCAVTKGRATSYNSLSVAVAQW